MPHVQHEYFSSLNQSNHCFLASSLPLPSSLRKLPINDKGASHIIWLEAMSNVLIYIYSGGLSLLFTNGCVVSALDRADIIC